MKWTGLNELRETFLNFYETKQHTRLASAPLVPQDEASLLLINSGMAPLKKYFTGLATLPNGSNRATSCQKCIRTPDIENVGKTARHGTYFEMLGNFSFGDYFKEEATTWAWEFCTDVLDLPVENLYVSVFHEDDEAYKIWTERRGVAPEHMVHLGREDNFWEIGAGPCGPCSEIYYDRGVDKGCGSPDCKVGCECDRFVEFWNLVFTQFNSDGKGEYTPLAKPNIDTGMGLERLACIMQGVDNLFEVDTVAKIMQHICDIANVSYKKDDKADVSIRVVTDHIRSTTFLIGDGVVPQNEGRGYVLRRLLRRAARHGRLLGITDPFLYKVCATVIDENKSAYPELAENIEYITKVIRNEEERFAKTIDAGLAICNEIVEKTKAAKSKVFDGEEAFKLYDTYGFPLDLTKEIAEENGFTVDEDSFAKCMQVQREMAREATKAALGDAAWTEDALKGMDICSTFVGYNAMQSTTKVLAIVVENALADSINAGEQGSIILAETPFYAESGGQVGDSGVIKLDDNSYFEVYDCKKSPTGHFIHIGEMQAGSISTKDTVNALVDEARRGAIMRNHSACHLLQAALQQVLGSHVHQAGSYVDEKGLRFDFSHFSATTDEELVKVATIANDWILAGHSITSEEMPIAKAKEMGAMALFGEKYGDTVRVVEMKDCSLEFCGGTHVDNTAKLGLLSIVKESSVAAGIRRIEATTGAGVLAILAQQQQLLNETAQLLKAGVVAEIPEKVATLTNDVKQLERALSEAEQKAAAASIGDLWANATQVGEVLVAHTELKGAKPDLLRSISDDQSAAKANGVIILTSCGGDKNAICVACGKDAIAAGANAGKIIKAITAVTGGNGGGRPNSAMGGINDPAKLAEAISQLQF